MVMTATSEMVMSGDPRICERSLRMVGISVAAFGSDVGVWAAAPFGADQIGQRGGARWQPGAGRLVVVVDGCGCARTSRMFLAWDRPDVTARRPCRLILRRWLAFGWLVGWRARARLGGLR